MSWISPEETRHRVQIRVGATNERELEIAYEWLPRGSIVELYRQQSSMLGEEARGPLTDAAILRDIMAYDARKFDFSWSAGERAHHAALVLCKMLLWEHEPVERMEHSVTPDGQTTAALVAYLGGKVKVVRAGNDGVLIVMVPPDAPSIWTASAASWLGDGASTAPGPRAEAR